MLLAQTEVSEHWRPDSLPSGPLRDPVSQRTFSTSKLSIYPSSQPSIQPASILWVLVLSRVDEGNME